MHTLLPVYVRLFLSFRFEYGWTEIFRLIHVDLRNGGNTPLVSTLLPGTICDSVSTISLFRSVLLGILAEY